MTDELMIFSNKIGLPYVDSFILLELHDGKSDDASNEYKRNYMPTKHRIFKIKKSYGYEGDILGDSQADQLHELGFTLKDSMAALQQSGGDLIKALSLLTKK